MIKTLKYVMLVMMILTACAVWLWLFQFAWVWVVPDIFAGAVEAGLITPNLTILQAVKLSILLGFLGVANAVNIKIER